MDSSSFIVLCEMLSLESVHNDVIGNNYAIRYRRMTAIVAIAVLIFMQGVSDVLWLPVFVPLAFAFAVYGFGDFRSFLHKSGDIIDEMGHAEDAMLTELIQIESDEKTADEYVSKSSDEYFVYGLMYSFFKDTFTNKKFLLESGMNDIPQGLIKIIVTDSSVVVEVSDAVRSVSFRLDGYDMLYSDQMILSYFFSETYEDEFRMVLN